MNFPTHLRDLFHRRHGEVQPRIRWPKEHWADAFPGQAVFSRLPARLGREEVRRACTNAAGTEDAATEAFLAAMAWGYGNIGYGAWRVAQALKDRNASRKLRDVAIALHDAGPFAAYGLLAGACRLARIGPAFGTKFLYFADPRLHHHRALILDGLVAAWLSQNTAFRVNPVPWAPRTYLSYLDQMHEWAARLHVEPDAVELAIFQEMAEISGSQWA